MCTRRSPASPAIFRPKIQEITVAANSSETSDKLMVQYCWSKKMVQNIDVHFTRRLYGIVKQYMNAKTLLFLRIIHTKHSIKSTVQRDGSGRY